MNEDVTLLKSVFDSSKKSSYTLNALLSHIDNKSMRASVITQIYEYDSISKKAGEEISALGIKPKARNPIRNKVSAWGKNMSVGIDPSLSHIAEIIKNDVNASTTEITRTMNRCINSSPKTYNLARMLVNVDNKTNESFKGYL